MKIFLASRSEEKRLALSQSLKQFFSDWSMTYELVDSGVNLQPVGLEEIYMGAANRARVMAVRHPNEYVLAMESGIVQVGVCWLDLAVILMVTPDGVEQLVTSTGVGIPLAVVEQVFLTGCDKTVIGQVIADLEKPGFENLAGDPQKVLSHGRFSRVDLLREATVTLFRRYGYGNLG